MSFTHALWEVNIYVHILNRPLFSKYMCAHTSMCLRFVHWHYRSANTYKLLQTYANINACIYEYFFQVTGLLPLCDKSERDCNEQFKLTFRPGGKQNVLVANYKFKCKFEKRASNHMRCFTKSTFKYIFWSSWLDEVCSVVMEISQFSSHDHWLLWSLAGHIWAYTFYDCVTRIVSGNCKQSEGGNLHMLNYSIFMSSLMIKKISINLQWWCI